MSKPGCQYMEKSFSVATTSYYESGCADCGSPDTRRKINGQKLCVKCFEKRPTKIQPLDFGESFSTGKDKLWEFVDIHTTGQPIEFTSKRAWKAHLKERGLTDDVNVKKLTEPQKDKKSDYRGVVEQCFKERDKFKMDLKYKRIPSPIKRG